MPLNVLRLNEKRLHPTPHIVFIKPLSDRPNSEVAAEFLNRIAAICHPILKANHLSVTTLEEFPPNREFVGRNFNNGECIQLVLRRQQRSQPTERRGGRGNIGDETIDNDNVSVDWLPFRTVVMVMMHELAHNVHMNHSRAFWAVRNQYADEMRALWLRGYTGEGMWGPGRQTATGIRVGGGRELDDRELPEHLCGGTYRSRRAKRKRKPATRDKLTWREQKERRIARKFGANGQALGEDYTDRMALQSFKGPTTKSRVAGSKRGRELRAAAALARFEKDRGATSEQENPDGDHEITDENSVEDGTGDEFEYEYDDSDAAFEDAKDLDGTQMRDSRGLGLIRVCDDENERDIHVKKELDEIHELDTIPLQDGSDEIQKQQQMTPNGTEKEKKSKQNLRDQQQALAAEDLEAWKLGNQNPLSRAAEMAAEHNSNKVKCKVCSLVNEPSLQLCLACANVLDPARTPGSWKCNSNACRYSAYTNSQDFGVCGACGSRR